MSFQVYWKLLKTLNTTQYALSVNAEEASPKLSITMSKEEETSIAYSSAHSAQNERSNITQVLIHLATSHGLSTLNWQVLLNI